MSFRHLLFPAILWLAGLPAYAGQETGMPEEVSHRPVVGLIIDDLGDRLHDGQRATALPGNVTCSILPQTTFSRRLAELAHSRGKEVMVHQPMQAENDQPMGPGGLSLSMSREQFEQTLDANLDSVPHARGLNNHMGSLLTRHMEQMAWLVEALQRRGGLYFVDSITTNRTVALKVAQSYQLPGLRRNIFLDHDRSDTAIREQFSYFIAQAKAVGTSLAIAHPYPETLQVLEEMLPSLRQEGIDLVPVSQLIQQRRLRREQLWQASLSPSPKDSKSSKQ